MPDAALRRRDLAADPIAQFCAWFEAARATGVVEPEAMTLATVDADGRPAARMVLLKDVSAAGFTFYTNHESDKARQLASTPAAALVFYWQALARQVRVTGGVERVDDATAAAYFATRPRGSQLGAWASAQSRVVADRETLEARVAEVRARFGDGPVPLPPFWGGYRVVPERIEFWQGRPDRLHDRFLYTRSGTGPDGAVVWRLERLMP